MSQFTVRGKVVYGPGPWGLNVPARSASVQIIDVDLPGAGSGDDTIWSGSTDSSGSFAGTTSEWQDKINLPPVWVPNPPPPFGPGGGTWRSPGQAPDPSDILLLKACVKDQGKVMDFYPFANDAPIPLILPWGPPNWTNWITKDQRALLVVQYLAGQYGAENWQWLYRYLDASGVLLADMILKPVYKRFLTLTGSQASKQQFLNELKNLGTDSSIKAIDVIINLHGSPEKLCFQDNVVPMSTLKTDIQGLNLSNKLRLLYSNACYGATHANEFVEAGFNAAVGAVGVNANSATEYPTVLTLWGTGCTLDTAVSAGENSATRIPADQAATAVGFTDVNSDKNITGDKNLNINFG